MSKLANNLITEFLTLGGDFRAEVFSAELIKQGYEPDRIYFKTVSLFKRPVSQDIEEVSLHESQAGDEHVVLEINREGLYDMLPEGVFHFKKNRIPNKDKETVLEEIRATRMEEEFARKFFGPFENEFFHRRLQLEIKARALSDSTIIESKRELFEDLFGNSSAFSDHQVVALLNLLPVVHEVRGDLVRIAYCLTKLTGYKVKIRTKSAATTKVYATEQPALGQMQLGVDSVAGNQFQSSDATYEVLVLDVTGADLRSFFENGNRMALLRYLLSYLLPVSSNYDIQLHLKKEDRTCQISDRDAECFLGFNLYI